MPSSMIEQVARTLCRDDGHPEDTMFEGRPLWESYRGTSRAVIAAMRTPTDGMMRAALRYNVLSDADRTWPPMIDAALTED